jgi:hypothetical protein
MLVDIVILVSQKAGWGESQLATHVSDDNGLPISDKFNRTSISLFNRQLQGVEVVLNLLNCCY